MLFLRAFATAIHPRAIFSRTQLGLPRNQDKINAFGLNIQIRNLNQYISVIFPVSTRKTTAEILNHKHLVITLGITFRKNNIYFLFYFQNLGGSLPASSSASARCTDIKKGTHPLLFFLPAMLIIIRKTIKKRSGI